MTQLFASDNASPVHPQILEELARLPRDHVISYGDDPVTEAATGALAELFGRECEIAFVYNGTGANVSALRSMIQPWQAVICTEMAHINEDEGGAPEAIGGFKLLGVHREEGRLRPEDIEPFLARLGFEHTNQPAAISITQSSEVGTVYWPEELRALCDAAHDAGFAVHMDGARIANAAAAVWQRSRSNGGRELSAAEAMRAVSVNAGVDVLSFGATKNGLMSGEAVVFFNQDVHRGYRFFRKQTTQLHSKMRYIAGQFLPYLRNDLWLTNAVHANSLAQELSARLDALPGWDVALPTEANGVFVTMPYGAIAPMQKEFGFYLWNAPRNMARLMVSWDTEKSLIDRFVAMAEGCI